MPMSHPPVHLRQEQKPLEHRSFSPSVIHTLVEAGYPVFVERGTSDPSRKRVFRDFEYAEAGATLVPEGSWRDAAPGTLILGLKELEPHEDFALKNDHIAYMHVFKGQEGWRRVMSRFLTDGSVLYDLEFLADEQGRHASAFSYYAGFAGAALGIKAWAWNLEHPGEEMPGIATFTDGRGFYRSEEEMLCNIREDLADALRMNGYHKPKPIIIGALGVCGQGAYDLFMKAGLLNEDVTRWDLAETRDKPGPYEAILEHDIFVNTIYLSKPIPPFITKETLCHPGRKLSIIVDVSCDITSPHNPIPVYNVVTTFTQPTAFIEVEHDQNDRPVSVISIDHLPSMLPREASEAFSNQMKDWLLELKDRKEAYVWTKAEKKFEEILDLLTAEMHMDVQNPKYSIVHPHSSRSGLPGATSGGRLGVDGIV